MSCIADAESLSDLCMASRLYNICVLTPHSSLFLCIVDDNP